VFSGIVDSSVVQISRNILIRILIRLWGWLDQLFGLFTKLLQLFDSFTVLLGFKTVK
jgi:hypothetical protein